MKSNYYSYSAIIKNFSLGIILLLTSCLAAHAAPLSSDQVKMDNKDFSFLISGNANFIQKYQTIGDSHTAGRPNGYLYVTGDQEAKASTRAQDNPTPEDNFIFVMVVPITKVLNSENAELKAQRAFMAFLVGNNQLGSTLPPEDYYENIEKNITEISLGDQSFQTYTLTLPNKSISYYTVIANNKMYSFQGCYFKASKSRFNDTMLRESLKTLVIK